MRLLYLWLSVLSLLTALQAWITWRHRRYFLGLDERWERWKREIDALSGPLMALMKDGVRRRIDELRRKWAEGGSANVSDVQEECSEFLRCIEKEMADQPPVKRASAGGDG